MKTLVKPSSDYPRLEVMYELILVICLLLQHLATQLRLSYLSTSETKLDYYYRKLNIWVASWIAKQHQTWDLSKRGNFIKIYNKYIVKSISWTALCWNNFSCRWLAKKTVSRNFPGSSDFFCLINNNFIKTQQIHV